MAPVRILIANHQPIIRSGLRLLLERETDFRVVAEAANGREAVVLTEFKHPDVAVLEVTLPHLNGIAVAKEISSNKGCTQSVFVTAHTDESYVIEAFKAGARGYVAGDSAPGDLARAIHVVVSGRLFLSPTICIRCLDSHLSNRQVSDYEKQLWCLLAAGYTEPEIAARLNAEVSKIRTDCRSVTALTYGALPDVIVNSVFTNQCATENG